MIRILIHSTMLALVLNASPVRADQSAPAVAHLAEALRIATVSHQERERIDEAAFEDFLAFVAKTYPTVFRALEVERINRYSLLMRWPGTQPELAPVLFDSHYDVVPIEPGTEDDWEHPPFSGAVADGFVWGRGAIDDKFAVVTTLDALALLLREGFEPDRTLYFSFVHDEEIGGEQGAGAVVEHLRKRGVRFEYVVGEGGGITADHPLLPGRAIATVALAEKTYLTLILRSTGTGGHSSTPPKDSAIIHLAKALTKLHENPFDARLTPPVDAMLRAIGEQRGGATGFVLRNQWFSRPLLVSQLAADPFGSAMVRTTTAVTMIEAGVKENVVPQRAEARVNFRVLPDEAPEDVIEDVKALIDDPSIEVSGDTWNGNPGVSNIEGEGYARVRASLEAAAPGIVVVPGLLMATTDSRHYTELTDDVYRFHPIQIGIEDAGRVHGTNERTPVSAVAQGVAIFHELIQRVGAR